ncbi:DUF7573 domain-containing protein [Halosimplex halophilum]|uniref:DUF7573 domain-containing protein n=1 Tax=Halosimplex halophilum TaxID=2559572 RepID=UPI00107F222C|nr:hypothetical protein [Halosimplex halophilum]
MGDRSLDDFLDGGDGDGTDGPSDRPTAAADDGPAGTGADDSDGAAETGGPDESTDATEPSDSDGEMAPERDGDDDSGGSDAETAVTAEAGEADEDGGETADGVRVDPPTVDPAESTYAWSRDGGTCAACGETVDRRWRSDEGLVCPDCKEW